MGSPGRARQRERADLILFGQQTSDGGGAVLWAAIAERMRLPAISQTNKLEIRDGSVRATRQTEVGDDIIEAPLPAIVAVTDAINELRYATLMGIKKAKGKEIKVIGTAEVSPASAVIEKLYAPEKNKQGQIFDGDPKAAAAKLVEKLRFEARVL